MVVGRVVVRLRDVEFMLGEPWAVFRFMEGVVHLLV